MGSNTRLATHRATTRTRYRRIGAEPWSLNSYQVYSVEGADNVIQSAKLRDECLNVSWFTNLWDARQKIAAWQKEFNEERPHSALGYQTPAEFARRLLPSSGSALRATPDEGTLSQMVNVV